MEKYGVMHGRFQIFHNDHLKYALAAKSKCETLIVGITSPDASYLIEEKVDPHRCLNSANPFSYFERMVMIRLALLEAGIPEENFMIVPFPIEKPTLITDYIPNDALFFLTIYDNWGNEKLKRLNSLGLRTEVLWRTENKGISATDIRNDILCKKDWRDRVPHAVYEYITANQLEKRIITS